MKIFLVLFQDKGLYVLIRVVQNGMVMSADVRQVPVHRVGPALHRSRELARGVARGQRGLRLDDIDDSLGPRQIQPSVKECPAGEFSGERLTGAPGKQRIQGRSEHDGRAVALKLGGVLSGIAAGST